LVRPLLKGEGRIGIWLIIGRNWVKGLQGIIKPFFGLKKAGLKVSIKFN